VSSGKLCGCKVFVSSRSFFAAAVSGDGGVAAFELLDGCTVVMGAVSLASSA